MRIEVKTWDGSDWIPSTINVDDDSEHLLVEGARADKLKITDSCLQIVEGTKNYRVLGEKSENLFEELSGISPRTQTEDTRTQ